MLNPRFYVNSVGNWASSVNPSVVVPITVGSKVFYHLEQEMVEKVLEKERPLYIVFAGSFMDNAVVKDLGQVCLTVSIVNQRSSGILTPFISYADSAETAAFANEAGKAIQAENASYAENADYAGSAGSAVIADNFFLVPAEELLRHLLNGLYALGTLHKPPMLVKAAYAGVPGEVSICLPFWIPEYRQPGKCKDQWYRF